MRVIGKYSIVIVLCYMIFSYLGCKKDNTIYNPVHPIVGDTLTLDGLYGAEEGDSALNSVFVDLSAGTQTTVLRTAWDLGFYSGTDNKVIINHSTGAAVIATNKTDWASVTAADSSALPANSFLIYTKTPVPTSASLTAVDSTVGTTTSYLANTVIQVNATASANKVYILSRGETTNTTLTHRIGMKIKITPTKNGYTLEYGALADLIPTTLQIIKNSSTNFNYISLTNGPVTVEPGKIYWDLEYTATTYLNADKTLPIGTTDFMLLNFIGGATAAQIVPLTDGNPTYQNFKEADTARITFAAKRDLIGVNWRTVLVNNPSYISINTDRFYVIKDPSGNIYKVNFAGGGSRGKPIIQYLLIHDATPGVIPRS